MLQKRQDMELQRRENGLQRQEEKVTLRNYTKGDKYETRKQALIDKGDNTIKEMGYGTLEIRKCKPIN